MEKRNAVSNLGTMIMSHLSGIKNPPKLARKRLGESRGVWVSKHSVHWLSSMDTLARRFERLVVVGVWLELFPKSGLQRTNSGRLLSEFRHGLAGAFFISCSLQFFCKCRAQLF